MHEVSIMGEIFEIINENISTHNIKKVNKVVLKIGEFSCVEDSALKFAFQAFSKDTESEKAELVINRVKAKAQCSECGQLFDISFTDKKCPKCHVFSNNIISGYELLLDEIEGE